MFSRLMLASQNAELQSDMRGQTLGKGQVHEHWTAVQIDR